MNEIEQVIHLLAQLPGLGPRSARRAALHLIHKRESSMQPLAAALNRAAESIRVCEICGNLDTVHPCSLCRDERRDQKLICVVEQVADLWALERSKVYKGQYHVLGGVLSAIDGVGPEDLFIHRLIDRCQEQTVTEVILATNLTVDGQTTAHYIADLLSDLPIIVSRLAHGVPVGGELDYLDDGTLGTALKARQSLVG